MCALVWGGVQGECRAQVYYNFTQADLTIGGTTYDSYALDNTYASITSNTTSSGSPLTMLFTTKEGGIGNLSDAIANSTGSGAFTRMFDISQPGNEPDQRGYNSAIGTNPNNASDNNPQPRFNQGNGGVQDPIVTPDIATVINVGGVLYYEFMLDGGESDGRSAISIDELIFFKSDGVNINTAIGSSGNNDDPTPRGVYDLFKAQDANVELIYSLDEFGLTGNGTTTTDRTLLVNLIEAGNGDPDFAIYVPVSAFITDSNDPGRYTDRIYLWVEMGSTGQLLTSSPQWGSNQTVSFDSSSTFEEWAFYKGGTPYSAVVPEAEVYVMGLILLGLAGFFEWRRRRSRSVAEDASSAPALTV
ncbi:MAG: hypothetical protein SFU85_09485 [Candidatus Methylacidiphilales bacterium]|nr:hypothetical protein [Candidatus Methylacidiphilales bacterium]